MAWLVEVTGHNGTEEKTLLFSAGKGIPFIDTQMAKGRLLVWESPSQRIDIGADGVSKIDGDQGRIVLANMPRLFGMSGDLDDLLGWVWQNRTARLYWVPGRVWSERVLTAIGVLEQPLGGIGESSTLSFELRDPRAALDTPLQPVTYAGDNVGPVGVEGGANLKGAPKPILYGLVSNFSPPRVNEALLIHQLADKQVTIICVRDGAAPLNAGVVRASLASMQANDPASGSYDIYKGAEGTFIRLGSTPIFNLTCDADEAANEAAQSHAQIWSRIRTQRTASAIEAASVTAADLLDSAGAGFYWDADTTQADALDEVLASFSGYEVQKTDGQWRVGKLVKPTGDPVLELETLTPTSRLSTKGRALIDIDPARPSFAPNGAPPYKVTVNWGRNYTQMDESQVAGGVSTRLKEKFSREFRQAVATAASIWDPVAQTGPWINAPALEVTTGYQPGADGLTSPGAEAEADRLLELMKPMRPHYSASFKPLPGDIVLCGDVVSARYPRLDLDGAPLFRVLQFKLTIENSAARAGIVLGFQYQGYMARATTAGRRRVTTSGKPRAVTE